MMCVFRNAGNVIAKPTVRMKCPRVGSPSKTHIFENWKFAKIKDLVTVSHSLQGDQNRIPLQT